MKDYVKALDNASWLVKIILALPFFDWIVFGLYRIFKGANKNDTLLIVFGILWIILPFLFIIDLISVILYKKLVWFA
jgi:Na+-driven multidrug efflux pump